MDIGDRVILTSKRFDDDITNPVWDGEYGYTVGTVSRRQSDKSFPVIVEWDNGMENVYAESDLDLYFEDLPKISMPSLEELL